MPDNVKMACNQCSQLLWQCYCCLFPKRIPRR